MKLKIISHVIACVFLSNCASIVSKSSWPVTISSTPDHANVKITDKNGMVVYNGSAPTTLTLDSSAGFFQPAKYTVEASAEGYTTSRGIIAARLNGWYAGNFIFGGLLGLLIIDPATGAMYKLPPVYNVGLSANPKKQTAFRDGVFQNPQVLNVNDIPDELKKKLVVIN